METMTLEKIYFITEIFGIIAVFISIIYLGIQVKQNTRSMRTQTVHDLSAQIVEHQSSLAYDKEMSDIYFRGLIDFDALETKEKMRAGLLLAGFFRTFAELHFQWNEGALDDAMWLGFKTVMEDIMHNSLFRSTWSLRKQQYDEGFQRYIDSILESESSKRGLPYVDIEEKK